MVSRGLDGIPTHPQGAFGSRGPSARARLALHPDPQGAFGSGSKGKEGKEARGR
jgi:hypothetical protein